MSVLYIDLETVPSQRPDVRDMVREAVKPPATYKKEESIKKWYEENLEKETDAKLHDTCFDGTFGEIVCIGWALDDSPIMEVHRGQGESEKEMIEDFFRQVIPAARKDGMMGDPAWCAHNGTQFDFRFLWQRCVVHSITPSLKIPYDAKPWSNNAIDTLYMWKGIVKAGGGLDRIAKALGVGGKGDMDGSKVYGEWLEGNIERIAEYCQDDVRILREIHNRMSIQ